MVDFELNELKREFLGEADDKAREMESALDRQINGGSLERLSYLAHQLKGSGGSYGYARISADAAEMEKAAESLSAGEADGVAERKLRELIGSLRAEIAKSLLELSSTSVR